MIVEACRTLRLDLLRLRKTADNEINIRQRLENTPQNVKRTKDMKIIHNSEDANADSRNSTRVW